MLISQDENDNRWIKSIKRQTFGEKININFISQSG